MLTSVDPRLPALLQREPVRAVTVAAADRTARVAWAIMTRGGACRAPAATAARQHAEETFSRCEDDES